MIGSSKTGDFGDSSKKDHLNNVTGLGRVFSNACNHASNPSATLKNMKSLVALTLLVLLLGCANTDSDKLREENAQLKAQLQAVTAERDAFKTQIEAIRKALDMPLPASSSPATTPDTSGTPAPVTPSTEPPATPEPTPPTEVAPDGTSPEPQPGSSAEPPPSTPEPAPSPEPAPATPEPTPPAETPPGVAVTPLYQYASDVLKAAQALKAEGKQPPLECSLGFEAGSNKVERSQAVKRCEVIVEGSDLRVRVEGIDGTVTTAP